MVRRPSKSSILVFCLLVLSVVISLRLAKAYAQSSASPSPVHEPSAMNQEINAAKATIELRYKDAFETASVIEVQKIWLHFTYDDRKKFQKLSNADSGYKTIFKHFLGLKVDFKCSNPTISGVDSTQLVCSEDFGYTDTENGSKRKSIHTQVGFDLKKVGGTWYIADMRLLR